jgi:rhodanese-related sulfurtransferase
MRPALLAALALTLSLAACEPPAIPPPEALPPTVSGAEVRARLGTLALVDVRTPEEFAAGHLPGAWNVPVDQLARRTGEIRERAGAKPVVVYCRSGKRAMTALAELSAAGIAASHLDGDYQAWSTAGMPVETDTTVRTERGREGWD